MKSRPLVSIVTPCFNGEAYIDRFFETVMGQRYPKIELILIDDGSTDGTYAKAEAWREKLETRGIIFKLLTQSNGGQASAINAGLPEVTGDYVTWPDCDDLMDPRNIELKVDYLESHPDKGLVVCDVALVLDSDLGTVIRRSVFDDSSPRLFDGLIREKCGSFCSGIAYMARASALFAAIGGRQIYESRSGQNWQLLFPLTYHNDCGFIHQELATYVVRNNSHSRSYTTLEERMRRTYELEDIIEHVLPTMGMSSEDLEAYMRFAKEKYLPQRFKLAFGMGDKDLARRLKEKLDEIYGFSSKRELLMLICEAGLGPVCLACGQSIKGTYRVVRRQLGGE